MSTPKTFKLENLNWKVRVRGGRELTYKVPINKPGIPYDVVDSAPDWPWYEHVEWEWLYFVYKGNVRKVLCALALEVKTVAFHVSTLSLIHISEPTRPY